MKAINYLRKIRIMDEKISVDILEIEQLESLAMKTTSVMDGNETVKSSGSQQKMADCVVKIVDKIDELNKEINAFVDYKTNAIRLIYEACEPDCSKLLYMRYIQGKKWEQIAVEMNYTYKWVSCGLHQMALRQLQSKLDEK